MEFFPISHDSHPSGSHRRVGTSNRQDQLREQAMEASKNKDLVKAKEEWHTCWSSGIVSVVSVCVTNLPLSRIERKTWPEKDVFPGVTSPEIRTPKNWPYKYP